MTSSLTSLTPPAHTPKTTNRINLLISRQFTTLSIHYDTWYGKWHLV